MLRSFAPVSVTIEATCSASPASIAACSLSACSFSVSCAAASYYEENAASLDTFDYEAYLLTIGLQTQYDDDGNAVDFDADELAAAQETLKGILLTPDS